VESCWQKFCRKFAEFFQNLNGLIKDNMNTIPKIREKRKL
jgi:hypothetical protein